MRGQASRALGEGCRASHFLPTAPVCSRVPAPRGLPSALLHSRTCLALQPQQGLSSLLSPQAHRRSFSVSGQYRQTPLGRGELEAPAVVEMASYEISNWCIVKRVA